ncbi:MAG: MMPL family transporter, partial [Desulfatibacillaceae bacterium]|nr:MMPL family transporter [Desulfatibacillaceae bacterium]
MISYIRFIIRYRLLVLAVFAAITLFFGWFFAKASLSTSIGELFFANNPDYEKYLEYNEDFSSDFVVLIGVSRPDLTAPENIARLAAAQRNLERNQNVTRVESFLTAQNISGDDEFLLIESYLDLFLDEPARRTHFLEAINADPMTRDWLLSRKGDAAVVLVETGSSKDAWEGGHKVIEQILAAFAQEGFAAEELYQAGLSAIMAASSKEALFSLRSILPITAILLFAMVFIMFRRFWPVILTMIITGMAVIWTMGLAVILFENLNIFTSSVPGIILIICFGDVIHLCSAYLIECGRGASKKEAIERMGHEVGAACAFTSITTFFGFVAMTLVPVPLFQQGGLLLGFGVAAALFTAMTLVPVFLSFIPKPKPWRKGSASQIQAWVDRRIDQIARLTFYWPRAVMGFFCIFFVVCLVGAFMANFETRFSERFGPRHPISIGVNWFEDNFPGTTSLYLYIDAQEGDLLDPELFTAILQLQEEVAALPTVVHVASLADLFATMTRAINPAMADLSSIPQTRQGLAQLLLLFESSGGENLEKLISPDRKSMRIIVRIEDVGVIETTTVGRQIAALASDMLGLQTDTTVTGLKYLLGDWVDEVLAGQRNGLIFALVTIAIFMIIATRSFKIGLLSMFPNVLPLLALLAWGGFFWEVVDTDTLPVLMIAIGIGVDDTIHFLVRFGHEAQKTDDRFEAVRQTLSYAGRAIFMTSIILIVGFAP